MDVNPLKQYFRQPAIYVRLPSGGKFWPPGALEVTPNGEYPVLPMTTLDEITYRTPDALFNGAATISVVQSCMPNIKDAWSIPNIDIDTILIAIRIATYGHELDITTKCPQCEAEADYSADLRQMLDKIRLADYDASLDIGDLKIYFQPMNYKQLNENSMEQFEEQKVIQLMADSDVPESEKAKHLGEVLKKITAVTTRAMAENIAIVSTPQAQVSDSTHIHEWLTNCDRGIFTKIRDHILNLKEQGEIPPLKIKCGNCTHQYEQQFTLDMSNFFADAS